MIYMIYGKETEHGGSKKMEIINLLLYFSKAKEDNNNNDVNLFLLSIKNNII